MESFRFAPAAYDRSAANTVSAAIAAEVAKHGVPFLFLCPGKNWMTVGLDAMWASFLAGRPTINGLSGQFPPYYFRLLELNPAGSQTVSLFLAGHIAEHMPEREVLLVFHSPDGGMTSRLITPLANLRAISITLQKDNIGEIPSMLENPPVFFVDADAGGVPFIYDPASRMASIGDVPSIVDTGDKSCAKGGDGTEYMYLWDMYLGTEDEAWGTGSDKRVASLILPVGRAPPKSDLRLTLTGNAFLTPDHPRQEFEIIVNGTRMDRLVYSRDEPGDARRIVIPESVVSLNEKFLLVDFIALNPARPKDLLKTDGNFCMLELGSTKFRLEITDGDVRLLGLGLRQFSLETTK